MTFPCFKYICYILIYLYVYLMNQMAAAQKQISYLLKTQFSCTTRTMVTQGVIGCVVVVVFVLIVSASVLVFVVLQANNGEIKYY